MNNYYGVKKVTESIEKHHPNERFKFAIDEGKIESFLDQRGMKIVSHMNHREIEKAFLLNENGSLIGPITGHFRFAMASPKHKSKK